MVDQPNFTQGIFQGEVLARLKAIELTCEQIHMLSRSLDDRLRQVEVEQEGWGGVKMKLEEHERRIRIVENSQTRIIAYATVLGAIVGAIAGFIGSSVKKLW